MIILIVLLILLFILIVYVTCNGRRTSNIELDVDFVAGSIDGVCENFKVGSKVNVAGILGADFLSKYKYRIDFGENRIWHNYHYISFKEAMELLRIPFIVLWQNNEKYIFIVDTGSSNSHISTEALNKLDYELDISRSFITVGVGGGQSTSGIANVKLYYK